MADYDEQDDIEFTDEYEYSITLLNSPDGTAVTLLCEASRELTSEEYIDTIRRFLDRADIHGLMTDAGAMPN